MKRMTGVLVLAGLAGVSGACLAAGPLSIAMHMADDGGPGAVVGEVLVSESKYGLVFTPALKGLPPGLHGFHVHENPSCAVALRDGKPVAALGAGGHYDPHKSGQHGSPWGEGHLGDLPPLYVDAQGLAQQPVLAPRLKLSDLAGRSLMIHAGGDNHADHPAPLGGGGARVVCGVSP